MHSIRSVCLSLLVAGCLISQLVAAPTITPLTNVTVTAGSTAPLWTANATGVTGTASYQWRRNGFILGGATSASFALAAPASRTDADCYDVVVTDSADPTHPIASNLAHLSVAPTAYPTAVARDPSWDANLEAFSGTGNALAALPASASVTPGGFYVGGQFTAVNNVTQTMLFRATSAGLLDPTFTPPAIDNTVLALAVQADGKVIVGGSFLRVNGALGRSFLIRLTTTGALDPTFAPALNGSVSAVVVDPTGQIVVGGSFTTVNGVSINRIVRLNSVDGSIDAAFNVGSGFNNTVSALAIQADGKLLVGGSFTTFNGATQNRLARLQTAGVIAGALDTSFNIGTGPDNTVQAFALQAKDGAILLGGQFQNYNGTAAVRLARISSTGALDTTYSTNLAGGFNNTVTTIALQGDTASTIGAAIVGGSFTTVGGVSRSNLWRITNTGAPDVIPPAAPSSSVNVVAMQADGHILLGASLGLGTVGGTGNARTTYARLNSDLTIDTSSVIFTRNGSSPVAAVMPLVGGKALVAGNFTFVRGVHVSGGLVRFNSDGSLDSTFNVNGGVRSMQVTNPGSGYTTVPTITISAPTSGTTATAVANMGLTITINNGGSGYTTAPAVTFSGGGGSGAAATATISGGAVVAITITNTGNSYTTAPSVTIAAPTSGTTATATASLGSSINSITITNGGSGYTATPTVTISAPASGTTATAQANINGAGTGNGVVSAAALLPDGRVAIGGSFTTYNGTTRNRIAVVKSDGTLDTSFNTGGVVSNITVTNGGSGYPASGTTVSFSGGGGSGAAATATVSGGVVTGITITNSGSNYTSAPTITIAGTGGTGATATSAPITTGITASQVFTLAALPPVAVGGQPRLFAGGSFTAVNGTTLNRVAIFNLDGSLDANFTASGTGADNTVNAAVAQPDGKIVIGGSFANYAGTARADLARILQTGALDTTFSSSFTGTVNALALMFTPSGNNGQIMVAGGTATTSGIARVNANGTLDSTFAGLATNAGGATVTGILAQEDGNVIARGAFLNVFTGATAGSGTTGLVRLAAASGARDPNFGVAGFSATPVNFGALAMLDDGRMFTTNNATGIALTLPAALPSISVQPQNQVTTVGGTATFQVTASGTPAVTYQWFFNGTPIPGATSFNYTLNNAQLTNVGNYSVVVSNELGSVTSSVATLAGAGAAPSISTQPTASPVAVGGSVPLNVVATGATNYQWLRNGVPIAGATSQTYTISGAKQTDSDIYSVIVGNGLSVTQSNPVRVLVTPTTYPNGLKPDATYALALETNAVSTGVIRAVVPDASGGFYVAGDFTRFGSNLRSRVAHFLASGSLDANFAPPSFDGVARALALDGSGHLLVGGSFLYVNGVQHARVVRLNATTGALDANFNAFVGTDSGTQVNALAIQSDGKILAGGTFVNITGGSSTGSSGFIRPVLVRLNSDGTPDLSYDAKLNNVGSIVNALLMLAGDKLVVGGAFNSIGGATLNNFAILTSAGVVDPNFTAAGTGPNGTVSAIAFDGTNLVLGGSFTAYGATTTGVNRIARVSSTGALDATFATGTGTGANGTVLSIVPLNGGAGYILGGALTTYNGTPRVGLAKIGSGGALDATFNPGAANAGTTTAAQVNALAFDTNATPNLIVGGDFNALANAPRARLGRLTDTTTGPIDAALNPDTLAPASAFAIAPQPGSNGKFLVLTNATRLNGVAIPAGLIRVDGNGALDATYNISGSGLGFVAAGGNYRMLVLQDGSAYISGNFNTYNGVRRNFLARVNADGTLDQTFNPGTGPSSAPNAFVALPGGQLLVGGGFGTFNGVTRNGLVRLNADGSIDASLQAPPSAITINGLALAGLSTGSAPDKFYIGGTFTGTFAGIWNNTIVTRLARLNPDGTLDTNFAVLGAAGAGANNTVNAFAVQPDGKVIVGGSFSFLNGLQHSGYARLNPDGSADRSYGTLFSAASAVTGIVLQSDGKAILKGTFNSVNLGLSIPAGVDNSFVSNVRGATRLTTTGIADQSFGVFGFDNFSVDDYALLDDGRVLVASSTPTVSFAGDFRAGLTMLLAQSGIAIADQPRDRTVFAGQPNATLNCDAYANGAASRTFQWRKGGVNLTPGPRYLGVFSRTLTFVDPQAADAGSYDCVVSDGTNSITSRAASLTVLAAAPTVTTPTVSDSLEGLAGNLFTLSNATTAPTYTYTEGTPVLLNGSATGTEPISYQWQKNGADIPGATSQFLDLGLLTAANVGSYTLKATNSVTNTTSAAATLALANATATAPVILFGPDQSQASATLGQPAFFYVIAAGTGTLSYQWQKNGVNIAGATTRELLIPNVGPTDPGVYSVTVSNATGSTPSRAITLSLANNSVWTWRHPLPTAAQLTKAAFGANRYVAVAQSGEMVGSTDGINWTLQNRFLPTPWNDVAFGNGKFVAVSNCGAVATSTDGLNWSFSNINAPGASPTVGLFFLLFDGTQFVATGGSPGGITSIYTSTNGIAWTRRTTPVTVRPATGTMFTGPVVQAFGNGTYVAPGADGENVIYTSTNLDTWTPHTVAVAPGVFLGGATFAGGAFYVVGDSNTILRSTDNGVTWTNGDTDAVSTATLNSIASNGTRLVAVASSGAIITSTDGIRWTVDPAAPSLIGSGKGLLSVTVLNNQFVATGDTGMLYTSSDGLAWNERFARPLGLGAFNSVVYGTPGFVAVGNTGQLLDNGGQVAFSTDGQNWTPVDIRERTTILGVTYAAGKYVAVGNGGLTMTSTNGTTWSKVSLGGNNLNAVAHDGTSFIAVGANGTITTSPDGVVWTTRTSGTTATLRAVAAIAGSVIAGGDGVLLRSTDGGVTWATPTVTLASTAVIRSLVFANNQFLAGGLDSAASGTTFLLTSSNGASWTNQNLPFAQSLRGIVFANGRYVAVGGSDSVLLSTDAVNWTSDTSDSTNVFNGLAFGAGQFVAVGAGGAIASAPAAPAPVIASVTPTQFGAGNSVVITGSGFTGATAVKFNGAASTNFTVNSDTQITATTPGTPPAVLTSGPVIVVAPGGTSLPLTNFVAYTAPSISAGLAANTPANDFATVNLSVTATGIPTPTYQWKKNGVAISGATSATYSFTAALADNNAVISVDVANAVSTVSSSTTLTVQPVLPTSVALAATFGTALPAGGGMNLLNVNVTGGSLPLTYQWKLNGANITGATSSSYFFRNAKSTDAGTYTVTVTNPAGAMTSTGFVQGLVNELGWQARNPKPSVSSFAMAAFANGAFYVGGPRGALLRTTDGVNWTTIPVPTAGNLFTLAYGNGTYVLAGTFGVLFSSTDGVNWIPRNSGIPVTSTFNNGGAVAFGNGRFVAAIGAGTVSTSTDGITWTPGTVADNSPLTRLNFFNGKFYGGGVGTIYSSADGVTWTTTGVNAVSINQVAYSGSLYVGAGASGSIVTSPDGITWTAATSGTTQNFSGLVYANNLFIATTDTGGIFTSPDGATWTSRASGTTAALTSVAVGNGLYLAAINNIPSGVVTSPDGLTWTTSISTISSANFRGIAVNGSGAFVVVGSGGSVASSPDGLAWTLRTSGTGNSLSDVTFAAGLFVAVGANGTIITSPDGTTWTTRTSGTTAQLNGVKFANNQFTAVGSAGVALTSPDGLAWTSHNTGTTQQYLNTAFGVPTGASTGVQVAVGFSGAIVTSSDGGATWTTRTSGTTAQLNDVIFANGSFLAIGSGVALSSPDGVTWVNRTFTADALNNVIFANGNYLATVASAAGGAANITYYTSTDGLAWTPRYTGTQAALFHLAATSTQVLSVGNTGTIVAAGAPVLTVTSGSQGILVGGNVTLSAIAAAAATPVSYQWQKRAVGGSTFANVTGATSNTLSLTNLAASDAGDYQLVATNSFGATTSTTATLVVVTPAAITTPPVAQTVNALTNATFTVVASGTPAPTYQWQRMVGAATVFSDIAGATSSTLTITGATPSDAGSYQVIVTNAGATLTSTPVTLAVNTTPVAITTQPTASASYLVGNSVTLTAAATGLPAPTYQWQSKVGGATAFSDITGATGAMLTIPTVALTDAGSYRVVATNLVGSLTSNAVTFAVYQPPAITTAPVAQTIVAGQGATFSVVASGSPAPTYQWQRGGLDITGATSSTLTLSNVSFDYSGNITVVIKNAGGTITSTAVALTVNPPAPTITSPATATGVLGRGFVYQVTTAAPVGTPAPSTALYSLASGQLPTGLTLDANSGTITGIPQASGPFNVTVKVTNVTGNDTKSLALTINPPPPIINSAASASGRQGAAFTFNVAAVNTPTSFGATGLPTGLSINSTTGVISGTPTTFGQFNVTLSATNSGGTSTSQFLITLDPPLNAPVYSGVTQLSGVQGTALSFAPTFTNVPTSFASVSGALPSGVTFNPTTGALGGTPTATGSFTFTFAATNAGGTTNVTLNLTINPPPSAPTITSASTANATAGAAFSFALTASGTPTITFAASGLPSGVTLNAGSGVISGTPAAPGTFNAQVSASNSVGTGPQAALVITVSPSPNAPTFDSASVIQGRVGVALNAAVHANNTPTNYAVTNSTTLPAGLALDATTGAITGTPTQVGQFSVWFVASNGNGPGYALQVLFNIAPALTTPVVTSNSTAAGQVGQPFSYVITASNTPTSFGATGLPAGLTVNTTSGVISGIPSDATTTALSIALTATNTDGTSTPKTLSLTIAPAPATPVITSPLTASGQAGSAFTYQVTASDNATSFVALNLPAGLALNSTTGAISGTTAVSGPVNITLRAANAAGLGAPSTLVATFAPAPSAPAISSAAAASGKVGVSFTYTITASGSPTSFGYTGNLPLGLALNTSTGVLSGKPAASGIFTVSLTASGAGGTSLPQSLVLNIAPADNVPVITSPIYASATVGANFSYQITASSLPAFPATPFPAPFTLDAVNLPAGLAVNPSTGIIEGQPTVAGVFTATLVGTNSAGTGPFRDLTIFIAPAPTAPTVTSSSFAPGQVGVAFSYQISGTNNPTSYDVRGAPAWMTVNSSSGAIAGTPTAPGSFTVQLVATNSAGSSNPLTLTLTIAPSANAPVVTSTRTASGQVSQSFSYQITSAVPQGAPAVTSYIATGLPAGLSLNAATGLISGTPTVSGQFEITLIARNSAGDSQPVTLILTIAPSLQFNG